MADILWDPQTSFLIGVVVGGLIVSAAWTLACWKESGEW